MSCEIAAVDIKILHKTLTIVCVYRPTSGKVAEFLEKFDLFLNTISSSNRDIAILGDFNINTMLDTTELKKFKNVLKQHKLLLEKLPPTRRTENCESSLDCCITNYLQPQTRVIKNLISDHDGIECLLNLDYKEQINTVIKFRDFSTENIDKIKQELKHLILKQCIQKTPQN